MALKKTIEINGNLVIQTSFGQINQGEKSIPVDALIKVKGINATKEYIDAQIHFNCGKNIEFTKMYSMPASIADDSPNFIKQVYLYLKGLPEFSGAQDC